MSYDYSYYEAGVENGISGYQNYRWIPEVSLPMAHHLITNLALGADSHVLDYGCAKGFLVKAFHLLGMKNTKGVDISEYAIKNSDVMVSDCLHRFTDIEDLTRIFPDPQFDMVICKDVLEHIAEQELPDVLSWFRKNSKAIFVAVPTAEDDVSNKFIIPAYHNDVTHITIKSENFWRNSLEKAGWTVTHMTDSYPGMKTNWTKLHAKGNLFLVGEAHE